MDEHFLTALIAGAINILLSIIVLPLLNKSKLPYTTQIKKHYECNKNFILVSTILTVLLVYVSLKVTPIVNMHLFSQLNPINKIPTLADALQENSTMQSVNNMQPVNNMQRLNNMQQLNNMQPTNNMQSVNNMQQLKNMQSVNNMQSTNNMQSVNNMQRKL